MTDDWFEASELFREKCDAGEACGYCFAETKLTRSVVLGIGLFTCPLCGCASIDCTSPATKQHIEQNPLPATHAAEPT